MFVLHSDEYLELRHFPDLGYVRLVRTDQAFGSISRVAGSLRECGNALSHLNIAKLGILLDWRLAPISTDPILLKHVVQQTDVFVAMFRRRALLMATPVGIMQSERLARSINHARPVLFNDEAAAVAYVTEA
jgi:hypothetical protein